MRPHYSQSSRENATPSSGTSPLASHKGVPSPGLLRDLNIQAQRPHPRDSIALAMKGTVLQVYKIHGLLKNYCIDLARAMLALFCYILTSGLF